MKTNRPHIGSRQPDAFTLVELLVVISIMGLIAALAVPALKNLGKSNIQASATRQMLDDIGRARQLAISRHTTVYMVFVPANFWLMPNAPANNWASSTYLTSAQLAAVTNLVDKQLTGYTFMSYGKVGDQPGQHSWHYLDDWKSLPDGTFIAAGKFLPTNAAVPLQIPIWQQDYAGQIDQNWMTTPAPGKQIYGFQMQQFPMPTETNQAAVYMPYIAFDHTGKLISETIDGIRFHHAYIPLAQGTVSFGRDLNKSPALTAITASDITENPAGNSTSISYNVIDVDPLSGRAKQLAHHIQ